MHYPFNKNAIPAVHYMHWSGVVQETQLFLEQGWQVLFDF